MFDDTPSYALKKKFLQSNNDVFLVPLQRSRVQRFQPETRVDMSESRPAGTSLLTRRLESCREGIPPPAGHVAGRLFFCYFSLERAKKSKLNRLYKTERVQYLNVLKSLDAHPLNKHGTGLRHHTTAPALPRPHSRPLHPIAYVGPFQPAAYRQL